MAQRWHTTNSEIRSTRLSSISSPRRRCEHSEAVCDRFDCLVKSTLSLNELFKHLAISQKSENDEDVDMVIKRGEELIEEGRHRGQSCSSLLHKAVVENNMALVKVLTASKFVNVFRLNDHCDRRYAVDLTTDLEMLKIFAQLPLCNLFGLDSERDIGLVITSEEGFDARKIEPMMTMGYVLLSNKSKDRTGLGARVNVILTKLKPSIDSGDPLLNRFMPQLLQPYYDKPWDLDDSSPLHYAARYAPHIVPILVKYGASAKVVNKNEETPLHCLVSAFPGNKKKSKSTKKLRYEEPSNFSPALFKKAFCALKSANVDMYKKDKISGHQSGAETAYVRAVQKNQDFMLICFIESGYKQFSKHHSTCLHIYAANQCVSYKVIEAFVLKSPNVINCKTDMRMTALHCYVSECRNTGEDIFAIDTFKYFGADPMISDRHGNNCAMTAVIRKKSLAFVQALWDPERLNDVNKGGCNLLTLALAHYTTPEVTDLIEDLLNFGADFQLEKVDKELLERMAKNNQLGKRVIALLFKNGFTLTLERCELFLEGKRLDFVETLLRMSGETNAGQELVAELPLVLFAVAKATTTANFDCALSLCLLLIDSGADANLLDIHGKTFLIYLLEHHNLPKKYDCLLKNCNIDLNAGTRDESSSRNSALQCALNSGRYHFALTMLQNFAIVPNKMTLQNMKIRSGFSNIIKTLVELGYRYRHSRDANLKNNVSSKKPKNKMVLEKEKKRLRVWCSKRKKIVDPLWKLASRGVRNYYGKETDSLVNGLELPEKVANFLQVQVTAKKEKTQDEKMIE